MNRRCDRCEFWHGPQLATNSNYGECRRNPPQRASSGLGGWPNTRPEQWCGEFSLDPKYEVEELRKAANDIRSSLGLPGPEGY